MTGRLRVELWVPAALGEALRPEAWDEPGIQKTVTVTTRLGRHPGRVVAVETSPDGREAILTVETDDDLSWRLE